MMEVVIETYLINLQVFNDLKMEETLYCPTLDKGYIRVRLIDNNIGPHYIIDNRHSRRFSGYRLIHKDLLIVKDALLNLIANNYEKNVIVSQSLSFMIIITYGKCFASAEGRKVKLDKASALKNLTIEEINLHNELILLRNQYVAHGGISKFETNPVVVTRTTLMDGEYGYMVHDSCVYMSALRQNLVLIDNLLTKVIEFVDEKIDSSFTNLMKFVVTEMPENEFESNSFIPDYKKLIKLKDII